MGDRAGGISSRSADAGAESVMAAALGQARFRNPETPLKGSIRAP